MTFDPSIAIAAGAVGIIAVLLFCIGIGAWAEKHGKPSAHIQWDDGE